ncbi:MAG: HD-GYP domain-containing protein [Pseudomonadota bacterium]
MKKNIHVNDLSPGMFVIRISRQQTSVGVNNEGWVRTQKSIQRLIDLGIEEVVIDTDKTLEDTSSDIKQESEIKLSKPSRSLDEDIEKVYNIYNNAKSLQNKIFSDLAKNQTIDLKAVQDTTSGIVDTIFTSKDAMLFASQIRSKDEYLFQHSLNVSILMTVFAKHLGFERETIEHLATGAFLHDVGKIKIPDEILNKPGALTEEEFNIMKSHVHHSVDALKDIEGLNPICKDVVAHHHERLDGEGYPYNLKGDELSEYARMINIVDVYDALTADRCYKNAILPSKALKFLMKGSNHLYDGELVQHFVKCIGLYPVGTLVKLRSGKVGVVVKTNDDYPLKPLVKLFYSSKEKHFTAVKEVDLSASHARDSIECSVKPDEFKINLKKFFEQMLIG